MHGEANLDCTLCTLTALFLYQACRVHEISHPYPYPHPQIFSGYPRIYPHPQNAYPVYMNPLNIHTAQLVSTYDSD